MPVRVGEEVQALPREGLTPIRILFIGPNRIGDAVITCGVLDELVRRNPGARVTVACGPAASGVYQRMPGLERVVLVEKHKDDRHWWRLWRAVAFTRWDLVVDVKGSALAWLVWARRRVVRRRRPGRMFEQHGAMLGFEPAPLPVAWTAAEDRARADALRPAGRPVVALGVTANWGGKVWPPERFAALVRALGGVLPGVVPAVFAGPSEAERAMAAPVLAALPGSIDLRGVLTLAEAAAFIGGCALFVGNDSGLMHLAAATGAPTVGLCAATNDRADEMAPAGLRARWALAEGTAMTDLSVEAALEACGDVLGVAAPTFQGPSSRAEGVAIQGPTGLLHVAPGSPRFARDDDRG